MKITPFNLKFNKHHIIGSGPGSHLIWDFGYVGPKGLFIHTTKIPISKDGIAHILKKAYDRGCDSGLLMSFPVRLIAILESIIFVIGLPFQLLLYTLSLVIGLITCMGLLVTLPCSFDLCFKNKTGITIFTNRTLCASSFTIFLCSILSLVWLMAYTALIPFQILVPELCVFVFKYHKWGTYSFDYFN